MNFKARVFEIVKTIPKGKVATYGDIAEKLGIKGGARAVGNALHKNTNSEIVPCHRVVNFKGQLAKNYAFGGAQGQKERLQNEGVCVNDFKVDLGQYRFNFTK